MRNAALVLGIIGGIVGMIVGFFSYGYTEAVDWAQSNLDTVPGFLKQVENVGLIRSVSFLAPLLAIAGGAMARSQATVGGALLLVAASGMLYAFGFGVFTMFPIGMCALGGVLALAARQPDPH
jgi:hypothetical protein